METVFITSSQYVYIETGYGEDIQPYYMLDDLNEPVTSYILYKDPI